MVAKVVIVLQGTVKLKGHSMAWPYERYLLL
jgi:hypothetical protein